MHDLNKEILESSLLLSEQLSRYGEDRHNTKEDIILLATIDDVLTQNGIHQFIDSKGMTSIVKVAEQIRDNNPNLRYCRFKLDDYSSINNEQNMVTFQLISDFINLSRYGKEYTLEEAIRAVPKSTKKMGIVVTYIDSGTKDWLVYQFTGRCLEDWEVLGFWQPLLPENKFKGYFQSGDILKAVFSYPTLGDYAYVGEFLDEAYVWKCVEGGVWTPTLERVLDYAKIVFDGTITIGSNGNFWQNGVDTGIKAEGPAGKTPELRMFGGWFQYSYNGRDWINIAPITDFSVTNNPDEDDLTAVDKKLMLADRQYDPESSGGKGRVYLRKNFVRGVNVLDEYNVRFPNTRYIIQDDFDLDGDTIEIPLGCILDFQGGSFKNGTLKLNFTNIITVGCKVFDNVALVGDLVGTLNITMFGVSDDKEGNFRALEAVFKSAKALGASIDWSVTKLLDLDIPADAVSIPLTEYNDFKGLTIRVNNTKTPKTFPLFIIDESANLREIIISKGYLDGLDYSAYSALPSGKALISVRDANLWTVREEGTGSSTPIYREDIIALTDKRALNRPIATYNNDYSAPVCHYIKVNQDPIVFKSLIFERTAESTVVTNIFWINYVQDITVEDIQAYTPAGSSLRGDILLSINNSAVIKLNNITIDNLYDNGGWGYGFNLENCFHVMMDTLITNNVNWGVFGCFCINVANLSNSTVNRFDVHFYARDLLFTGCKFRSKYNQLSSLYGNVQFIGCSFDESIPILYEGSYNAYTAHDVLFDNCTFNKNTSAINVVSCYRLTANVNPRPELAVKCLPNIIMRNCNFMSAQNRAVVMFNFPTALVADMDYMTHILIDNARFSGVGNNGFEIANRQMQMLNTIKFEFNNVVLFPGNEATMTTDPKYAFRNPIKVDNLLPPAGMYNTVYATNSKFGLLYSAAAKYNYSLKNCTVLGLRYYTPSSNVLTHKFENCNIYLTNIDESWDSLLPNATYDGCHFVRVAEGRVIRLYAAGNYVFKNCTKKHPNEAYLQNGLATETELFGIEVTKPTSSEPVIYQYTYITSGSTALRPVLPSGFACRYYDRNLNKFIMWNGTEWLNEDGSTLVLSGDTASRPTTGRKVGLIYLDTTLNKLIVWDGFQWKDFNYTVV